MTELAHALRPAPRRRSAALDLSTPRLLVGSFALLCLLGTVGFLVLPGLWLGERPAFIDALFMATSAVCVTGLSVVDVSSRLSFAGQLWLLALIQAGGLGILTFAAGAAHALGARTSLELEEAVCGPTSFLPTRNPWRLLRAIVVTTAAVEAAGALVLWLLWRRDLGAGGALWPALFHAVSAFCNAGFSIFRDNLVGYAHAPAVLGAIGALIVIGGIGFPVIEDLRARLSGQRRRASVHTRLVLWTTAILIVGPALVFLAIEGGRTLAGQAWPARIANALFLAITPRTAGFNAVSYDALANPSILLTLLLMWIGGSPASTAGGVKTTTVAVLSLALVARLRGRHSVTFRNRTLPEATIQRAAGLVVGALCVLGVFVFGLLLIEARAQGGAQERHQLVKLVFEAQSALGTVGLTLDATPNLSGGGRLLVVVLMFVGRLGPLVAFAAMSRRRPRQAKFRLAREDVLVG